MTGDSRRCPDPETLAAFVAGSLSGPELTMTAEHIRDCEDCREVLAAPALIDREYTGNVLPMLRQRRWPWWLAAAAAAITAMAYLVVSRPWKAHDAASIQILVQAMPREGRTLEPRLTGGFPWAPLRVRRATSDGALDADQMKLVGAAGTVLEQTANDSSPEARHAAAIAHLVAGRPAEAAEQLTALAGRESDARIWSDLAAARYALALQRDDTSQLAGALAAADMALQLAPALPEARFNRALIIDRLGLREQARSAWQQYLAVDPAGPWANEAKRHLSDLTPRSEFREELQRSYASLQRDASAARTLARRFPQEARVWGGTEILARWAAAQRAGDASAAERHLNVARAFGEELVESTGEGLLRAAVASIERANARERNVLAGAHLAFRGAQFTYGRNKPAEAERLFVEAERAFASAASPLALAARYFAANTAFDQGRNAEARGRLEQLAASAPAEFPAHRAQVGWQLGLVYASDTRWGDAIVTLSGSIALFERLGEYKYATSVREILAEVYDRIGDRRMAWKHRVTALRHLGQTESLQLQVTLDSIGHAAALEAEWPVAISFLSLELDMARRSGDDFRIAQILVMRARVQQQRQDRPAAAADLAAAARAIVRLDDPGMRERAEADRIAAEGLLAQAPAEAATLLGTAIDFHRFRGRRMFLPELLLHRSRALLAMNRTDAAAADLDKGIEELEKQRTSLEEGEARLGVFGTADELFEDAVALAVDRGQNDRAFTYLERARARQLLESIGIAWTVPDARTIPQDAVVVEYASLPARLLIFIVHDGTIRVIQRGIPRAQLRGTVERLGRSVAARNDAGYRLVASELYDIIVAPIAETLPPARTLVLIPDASLRGVPFSALVDRSGRYLVEQRAIVVAPSAAVFVRLAERRARPSQRLHLLVVGGPPAGEGDLQSLAAVQRETMSVATAYGELATIAPKDVDAAAFERRAATSEVVHFAGHTMTTDEGRDAALVVSRSAGPAGRLDVRNIASMSLPRTRVVVVAACSSARGEERAGEGGMSVARAFLAAGVPSVMATLWPIDDAAAASFFPRVHRHLAAGVAPAEALRAAQLESIQQRDAPLDMWAAVQVLGS